MADRILGDSESITLIGNFGVLERWTQTGGEVERRKLVFSYGVAEDEPLALVPFERGTSLQRDAADALEKIERRHPVQLRRVEWPPKPPSGRLWIAVMWGAAIVAVSSGIGCALALLSIRYL
jgi:hypothetical protein